MGSGLSPAVKVAGFAAALALTFALAFGGARALAPDALASSGGSGAHGAGMVHGQAAAPHGMEAPAAPSLHGYELSAEGFRMVPATTTLASGEQVPFRFRVLSPSGTAPSYRLLHERELHLIVVRRDLTGFQHVHPVRADDGTWTADLRLPAGGTWRAYADLSPVGGPEQLTLGVDLQVGGPFEPGGIAAAATPTTDDVRFDRAGERITIQVARGGTAVVPDPYLGARGHLVAIRAGDLGYAHVHPLEAAGPGVAFAADLPPGSYALFFDYSYGGAVTTATSTLEVQ